jgi:hypothetical protein
LTTPEAEEQGKTAPIELAPEPAAPPTAPPASETPAAPAAPAPPEPTAPALEPEVAPEDGQVAVKPEPEAEASMALPAPPQTMYVPLAVTIGDGFKFGCGFFLALVLTMLVGFVLLAALFVLTSLFGLNLPLTR